jgi:two-component system, cell cycle sensor histidine kinase and response regulator CckA
MHATSDKGVLIVEDEEELRSLFAVLLEMEGYRVFQAQDGRQGLDFLQKNLSDIKLIIADLNLPKMGGIDLIGKARILNPSVKIIGTSGLSSDQVQEMVLRAGAQAFLPKPFQAKEALQTVRNVIEHP